METEMIGFSSKSINFGSGEKGKTLMFEITNKNPTHSLVFKIKATKLNIY
jgi:hypothetical protein